MFGGMTLFILGTYVDGINGGNIEEIICSVSEGFCVGTRAAFSGAVVSILFLVSCNLLCIRYTLACMPPCTHYCNYSCFP